MFHKSSEGESRGEKSWGKLRRGTKTTENSLAITFGLHDRTMVFFSRFTRHWSIFLRLNIRAGRNKTIMLEPFSMKVLSASCVNSVEIRRSLSPLQDMVRTFGACRSLLCGNPTTVASQQSENRFWQSRFWSHATKGSSRS
jgi:hypothetical protein